MLEPRRAVRQMKEYLPPLGGRSGLRLDFNENTAGPSPRVLEALRQLDGETLARYPEREPVERVAAEFLDVLPANVLLTNGVDEAIHLLCQTYVESGDEVLIPVPTFSMYEVYAGQAGANVVSIESGDDFRFPTERILRRISPRTRLIAIANPNNPTGAAVEPTSLLRIVSCAPHAAVLVDEAYFEFYGQTLLPRVHEFRNLFVARTFSKAYGMAGLRIGVLLGNPQQMSMVRRVASPYNVNAAALACLPAAIRDQAFVSDYVQQVRDGRALLQQTCAAVGLKHWPSEANFVLVYLGDKRSAFLEAMKRRGVLLRDRNGDPGCAGCVRITVGTRPQTECLLEAMRDALAEVGWAREVGA
jgi:histidinol-phosphate aminotransferase